MGGQKFAVLLCAEDSDYVKKIYGGYYGVFVRMLKEEGEEWDVFRVARGEFPAEDDIGEYEGFVITGSCNDAHGNDLWICKLLSLLKKLDAMKKKVLGICFGHQSDNHKMKFVRAAVAEVVMFSSAPDRRSLYEVLRIKQNTSQVEIKTEYHTLTKLYHPDATSQFMSSSVASSLSSDDRDFIEIHRAYVTLSDPEARAVYDSNLSISSQRRWSAAGELGYHSSGQSRFHLRRRWETDQCW